MPQPQAQHPQAQHPPAQHPPAPRPEDIRDEFDAFSPMSTLSNTTRSDEPPLDGSALDEPDDGVIGDMLSNAVEEAKLLMEQFN